MINRTLSYGPALLMVCLLVGCGQTQSQDREFSTSGSAAADQRAEQRMARQRQLQGAGGADSGSTEAQQQTLYQRLGGEQGIALIVDDFLDRAMQDPRVNWTRAGVPAGGLFVPVGSVEWDASPENIQTLKRHMAQFFSLATGGPTRYDGRDMTQAHQNLRITNAEFDAAIGDLKATLDKLAIPDQEQKELLAIIETTRTQVVEVR